MARQDPVGLGCSRSRCNGSCAPNHAGLVLCPEIIKYILLLYIYTYKYIYIYCSILRIYLYLHIYQHLSIFHKHYGQLCTLYIYEYAQHMYCILTYILTCVLLKVPWQLHRNNPHFLKTCNVWFMRSQTFSVLR